MIRALFVFIALLTACTPVQAAARVTRAPAYKVCPDGTLVRKTKPCPVAPTPPPVPPPVPVPLSGASDIASNFDVNAALQPSWGTGAIAPVQPADDPLGAFRFHCKAGQLLRDDPIVYPGSPGASHLHQFYGNTSADAYSTYASLRASGNSTCEDGNPLNRSGYWVPAMLNGIGSVVRPDYVAIYYKRRPKSDPNCKLLSAPGAGTQQIGECVDLPNGLKFIFGYDMLTRKAPTGSLWFNCDGPTGVQARYTTFAAAKANCPLGSTNRVGAVIEAPQCWDGKNLDSANHRDHVAYADYGTRGYQQCPLTHPYNIPSFTLGEWFTVDANLAGWRLSSDDMIGTAPGVTFHADFLSAWDPIVKAMWHAGCINSKLNCSGGDLGNGKQLIGATGSPWLASPRLVPVP